MRKIYFILCLLFISWSVIFLMDVNALEKPTHSSLNGIIVNQNKASLNTHLNYSLGFSKGVEEIINGKQVIQWIQDGGEKEDEPFYTRSLNHFHNPLLPWDNAGYIGTFKSAILWAQDQGAFGSSFGGNYSWKAVRKYYYIALTGRDLSGAVVASDKDTRDKYFADTFRGLGQLMHLVEDMSVPSHTRNDGHVLYDYEKWVLKNPGEVTNAAAKPILYGGLLKNISDLFDNNLYNSPSPDPSVTTNSTIGLSEYTNANFFSEDTINSKNFSYPNWSNTTKTYEDYQSADGKNRKREYYSKKCCGETNGVEGYLLAAGDFLYDHRVSNPDLSIDLSKIPVLDNNVYKGYATLLIPRAVGYSAGLLNYFFRGSIDMVRDTDNDACKYVVYNLSNEYMEGTFGLYYDDASGNRNSIPIGELTVNANDKSEPVTLDINDEEKKKSQYILVFQGTMGNETGAVVADAKVTPFTSSCGTELTISGAGTTSKNSTELYIVDGCTGCEDDVNWEITGEGANIDKTGLLSIDKTACGGTATITAKCPICKTEITKTITIPDSITISAPDSNNCYTASGGAGSYTWDISKGSIDSNGCVTTTTGQCGITTVTITDANGCKTTTTVTLPDTLTITGPEAPVDGSCYITTGGTEPYTWDITKGTIDEKGCVDLKGQCGTVTVKAKDVNECTGKKEVNIPAVPLDISGADMIAKNSSETYSASGCSKAVSWSVTGKGATIEPLENIGALLKTDETACREITITAKCPDCNTEASKNVSVSDTCGTLTISGSDTTVKSSTRQYTMNGCCGEQKWSVSGAGVSISSAGLLTTTSSACGSLLVTATCEGCGTSATQYVRVTNAGVWYHVSSLSIDNCSYHYNPSLSCEVISGDSKISYFGGCSSDPDCGTPPSVPQCNFDTYCSDTYGPPYQPFRYRVAAFYEWRCP